MSIEEVRAGEGRQGDSGVASGAGGRRAVGRTGRHGEDEEGEAHDRTVEKGVTRKTPSRKEP
jgi:hypothetical protein